MPNLYTQYFEYTGTNETPIMYHRWAFASIAGALISRNVYMPFGHKRIYPISYIVFVDSPASRKSTAITTYAKPLLLDTGYRFIAADKTTKEKFWADLQRGTLYDDIGEEEENDPWDTEGEQPRAEATILCDEMADFMSGQSGEEFAKNLSKMWDAPGPFYTVRTKNAGNARLREPTIHLLGACTPAQLTDIFGTKGIGSGFFSRILFLRAPRRRDKVPEPSLKLPQLHEAMVTALQEIRETVGVAIATPGATKLLHAIYLQAVRIHDMRLDYYYSRRHEHLLRLCIVNSLLLNQDPQVTEEVVIYTNTMLYLAECMMPRALGEYGTAKAADISQIIADAVFKFGETGVNATELYKIVATHVDSNHHFAAIVNKLAATGRIQKHMSKGVTMIFPNQEFYSTWPDHLMDFGAMHPDENPYDAGLLSK